MTGMGHLRQSLHRTSLDGRPLDEAFLEARRDHRPEEMRDEDAGNDRWSIRANLVVNKPMSPSEYTTAMRDHFIATDHASWLGTPVVGFVYADHPAEAEYPTVCWPNGPIEKRQPLPVFAKED